MNRMNSFRKHFYRFSKILLLCSTALICVVCNRSPKELQQNMDEAEKILSSHPDSGLRILEDIDTTLLKGREDKARYALLKSIALDKNYVDTTSFQVLQPAMDYYEKKGSADEKLKTRYYEGRIYQNRGELENALMRFLYAAQDSVKCKDKEMLAKVYVASGAMYYAQYDYTAFMDMNKRAGNIYHSLNDTVYYLKACMRVLLGAILTENNKEAKEMLAICQRFPDQTSSTGYDINNLKVSYDIIFGDSLNLKKDILDLKSKPNLSFQSIMNLAYATFLDGNAEESLKYLSEANAYLASGKCNLDDSIKYNSIAPDIFVANDMPKRAIAAYKDYIENITHRHNYLFNSQLMFTNDKYKLELDVAQQKYERIHSQIVASLIIALCVIFLLVGLFLILRIKKQRKELRENYRILTLKYGDLMEDNRRLEIKSRELIEEVENLDKEKIGLESLLKSNHTLNSEVDKIIKDRIEVINDLIREIVTDNLNTHTQLTKLRKYIKSDKERFLNYLYDTVRAAYPKVLAKCISAGLDKKETYFVCFLAIGLYGKEASSYLGVSNSNKFSARLRKKMNVPEEYPTFRQYISNLS